MSLHLLLPLMLIPAKFLEQVMRRNRFPSVVGAILAGILLGPALLDVLPSEQTDPNGRKMVQELARIGLCVLLFKIGIETRVTKFLACWKPATGIAITGMIFPLLLGYFSGILLGWSQHTSLFVGATMTATSIGITASVLSEMHAQESREGMLILGAAILDDVLGLLLLAALIAVATPSLSVTGQVIKVLARATAFITGGLLIGPYIVRGMVFLSRRNKSKGLLLVCGFSYLLLMAYSAKAVGLDMILGAYAAGVALARHPDRNQLDQDLWPLTELLTPLFFILLGATVEFTGLNPLSDEARRVWGLIGLLLGIAVVSKLFSGFWLREDRINKWAIGSGMMPRGEVGFVFAQIGMSAGIFSTDLFSIIVIMIVATTVIGPVLLRKTLKNLVCETTPIDG